MFPKESANFISSNAENVSINMTNVDKLCNEVCVGHSEYWFMVAILDIQRVFERKLQLKIMETA